MAEPKYDLINCIGDYTEREDIILSFIWTIVTHSEYSTKLSFFYGQEKFRIRGVAANCTWGLTVSDPGTQPCSLRPVLWLRLLKLANSLTKG